MRFVDHVPGSVPAKAAAVALANIVCPEATAVHSIRKLCGKSVGWTVSGLIQARELGLVNYGPRGALNGRRYRVVESWGPASGR